jgi:hypothetical protein
MLADSRRLEAYRKAVFATVRAGDVVLDLGAGVGILSFFACQAGASRVYAIEAGPIAAVAELVAQENGLSERVRVLRADSRAVQLPEPADVLVTETLWNFGVGEGILGLIGDARTRLLRAEARIIPTALELFVAPLEWPALHKALAEEPNDVHGIKLDLLRRLALSNVQSLGTPSDAVLAMPQRLSRLEMTSDIEDLDTTIDATIERAATIHGFGGWFRAELAPSVWLSNDPAEDQTHWGQAIFPLERPLDVAAGDRVNLRMQTSLNGSIWRWKTTLESRNGEVTLDQSTFWGFPPDTTREAVLPGP